MKRTQIKKLNRMGVRNCEICDEQTYLVEHHIRGREIHNANALHNLAYVCDNCHRKIHVGDIILENRLMTTEGLKLMWHKKGENSFSGNDATVHTY